MSVLPEEAGKTDVVVLATYTVTATDSDYSASFTGVQPFSYTEGPFTQYEDLKESQVIGWVKSALGENGLEAVQSNLVAQIEAQKNPPVTEVFLPLPW